MPCHVYNPHAEIRLNVDDSPVGLGGILEQKHLQNNGDSWPVTYANRTLSETERMYSQIECGTIFWSFMEFHIYLYGTNLQVFIDHKQLVAILTAKHNPSDIIQREILKLQSNTFRQIKCCRWCQTNNSPTRA